MKKILSLLLVMLLAMTLLISCNGNKPDNGNGDNAGDNGGTGNGDNSGSSEIKGNIVFSPDVSVTLIKGEIGSLSSKLLDYTEAINAYTGRLALLNVDLAPKSGNEIVLGNTTREITASANKALENAMKRLEREYDDAGKETKYLEGYAIYSEGGSVAIVWTDDIIAERALDFFLNNFITAGTLALEDGYLYMDVGSILEMYRAEEDAEREEKYAAIEKEYGADVVQALRNHLSMFDENFYLWLADLYDPGLYDEEGNPLGGGFYFSNSGRDNAGFDIDLESTTQVLSFLSSAGMVRSSSQFKTEFPERIQKEIIAFVLRCQSPVDGYFYHHQWGTNISTSRQARDLSWATSILNRFGAKPYWNTPSGVEGIYGEPPGVEAVSALCEPLSLSSVTSVSKVLPAAKKWNGSAQLATLDSWRSYFESFAPNIHTQSYSIGNTFSSQSSQIKNRDALALQNGELKDLDGDGIADGGYIEMYETYFNSWQIPSNGLWQECSVEDGTVYYNAINGLMKISGTYQSLGLKFPNAEKAFACAVFMLTYFGDGTDWRDCKGDNPDGSVDTYNCWVAISRLLTNIATFGSKAESDMLRQQLKDNAEELIIATTTKIAKFRKDDGSYGYRWGGVGANSQGVPVAVGGTIEGDVNGGGIAFTGTWSSMCEAFGISGLYRFGYSDLLVFIDRISSLEPVIKNDAVLVEPTVITFDDENIGEIEPEGVTTTMNTGSVVVVADPYGNNDEDKVLSFTTKAGKGSYLYVPPVSPTVPSHLVLAFDMCFDENTTYSGSAFQIRLHDAYMLTARLSSGKLIIGDSSSTDGSVAKTNTFFTIDNPFEWHSFRIEYHVISAEDHLTVTKIYLDGKLRALSTNYYGIESDKAPAQKLGQAFLYALNGADFTTYFDNLLAFADNDAYTEEEVFNPDRIKDFESAKLGTTMPNNVTGDKATIVKAPTEKNDNNYALSLKESGASATINSSKNSTTANVYSLTTSMIISGKTLGNVGEIYLVGNKIDTPIAKYIIAVYEENGETLAKLTEVDSTGKKGESFVGIPTDTWVEITIEFHPLRYQSELTSRVYLNGELLGFGNTYYAYKTIARDYTAAIFKLTAATEIIIDDVIPETVAKDFVNPDGITEDAPDVELPRGGASSSVSAESSHNGYFNFEGVQLGVPSIAGLSTSVNVEPYNNIEIVADPLDSANKVLRHVAASSTTGANYSNYIYSKVSPKDANCYVFSFDVLSEYFTSSGLQPTIYSEYNSKTTRIFETNTFFTGDWTKGSGTVTTKSEVEGQSSKLIIPATTVSGWLNIKYEIYVAEGIVQIYYNDVCVGETDLFYTENSRASTPTQLRLYTPKAAECTIYIDNVVAEGIVKPYEKKAELSGGSGSGSSSGSSSGGTGTSTGYFDFEASAEGVPSIAGLTTTIKSSGYAKVAKDPVNAINKVLAFSTTRDFGDTVMFSPKPIESGKTAKKVIFEFDVCFGDHTKREIMYQIFFGESYLINLGVNSKGDLYIGDASGTITATSTLKNYTVSGTVAKNTWHKLRIEYGLDGGVPTAKIYLDGNLIATSNNFYDPNNTGKAPAFNVTYLKWYAVKDAQAVVYIDNVSFVYSDEAIN